MVTHVELDTYLSAAVEVARKAGGVIREAFNAKRSSFDKKSATDPVTETDRKVEELVISSLKSRFPSHSFVGEESVKGEVKLGPEPTWVIDPIDGTANFVHRIPFCAVSIGLAIEKEIVVGVVYNPVLNELFEARKGSGSRLNGNPISTSGVTNFEEAMVISEYGSDRTSEKLQVANAIVDKLLNSHPQALRAFGSAAIDCCYVACGRCDMYVEYGPWVWDLGASYVIVTEAGGKFLHPTGSDFDLTKRAVLVANPYLIRKLTFPNFELSLAV
mmetsp:Transcript_6265/g.18907  ORF Transcript_6265/g.18907 Transcript_6265/m.18907 type:complete len:273 (-) Transcript_6265:53-871(-)